MLVDRHSEGSLQVIEADLFLAHLLSRQGEREKALGLAAASRRAVHAAKGEDHWMARLARTIEARL